MVKKRPQLNPDDLGRLRWALGAILALLSVVTVFFMEVDAWLLMPTVALAAVAALIWPQWPARLPGFVHRLAFPFIALAFVYDLTRSQEPLPALIRLDLLLIFYRIVTYRQRRDDLQLVILGLFLIVVAGVITVSLSFAVQLLAFTGCALIMLLAVTLEYADGTATKPPPPGVVPSWARGSWREFIRRLRASTDWRLVVLGIGAFAAMVVVSGLLFLAIPRFDLQSSLFIDRLINRTTRTGFSENIHFGEVTSITQDDGLAFSVDITDPTAMPAVPYWRMVVLDEYTGEGFRVSEPFRRALNGFNVPRSRVSGTTRFRRGQPIWTFYVEPGVSRYLPLLGNFYEMTFTEPQTFGISDVLRIVALQRDPPKMFAYRTSVMAPKGAIYDASFALTQRERGKARSAFDQLPVGDATRARLTQLLAQIGSPTDHDAIAFALATRLWLERTHAYAIDSTVPAGSGDTLIRWLDSATPGHCELFAGSFVLLARAAGFPARLVAGFRGGSWNEFSGSFAVRNSSAHAWCEIFDESSSSWIRVDPTPGNQVQAEQAEQSGSAAAARARDRSWQARIESLRVFWYRRIVNFDLDTQAQLLSSTKAFFKSASRRVIDWGDARTLALKRWIQRPWDSRRFLQGAAFAALGLGLAVGWWRFGRRWWSRVWHSARPGQADPVRREAGRWLSRGSRRAGFQWPDSVHQALLRLRFGPPATWPKPSGVFRAARRALR